MMKTEKYRGRRLLLADDCPVSLGIVQRQLSARGIEYDTASDGKAALRMFCASAPGRYSAVVTDIRMPLMDGCEESRCIRASAHPQAGTIPIIALSSDNSPEDIIHCRECGINVHLSKPIDIKSFFKTLDELLRIK